MNLFKFTIPVLLTILYNNSYVFAQKNTVDTVIINEIVIKASKIDETIHNSASTVSVMNKSEIEKDGINTIEDINSRIPNFFTPKHGSRLTSPVYIRGIGSRINSQAVGLYVDNIPYFEAGTFNFELYGIDKIEVLRGPQGTLYGRNTMGGLINIQTSRFSEKEHFSFKTDYGNRNYLKSVIAYNRPLGEKAVLLTEGAFSHFDGFFKNIYLNNYADSYNVYSGRMKFQYKPVSGLKINFTLGYERNLENGYPYALYDTTTQKTSEINYNRLSTYHRDLLSAGLNINYKLKRFELTSSGSFQLLTDTQRIDQDFTEKNLFFVNQNRNHKTFVQEFTARSLPRSKVKWIAGLFGFSQFRIKNTEVQYLEDAVAVYHLPGMMVLEKNYNQPDEGAAGYGQLTLPFKRLYLTAGIRVDYEKDKLIYAYDRVLDDVLTPVQDADTFNTYFQVLPKISLLYKINNQINSYVSITKGYKAGGFNSAFERNEDISFNPEYSYNYEWGTKGRFAGGKLHSNLTFFYIDWRNQQVYQPVPSGRGAMLKNAGHSMSKGVEFEFSEQAIQNFRIWLNTGYNDVRYSDYVKDENTDYSGNVIPYIPQYTGNLGAAYTVELSFPFIKSIYFSLDYKRIGKFYWNDVNSAFQNGYGLLDANITLTAKKYFEFGFTGTNLLNAEYNSYYFEALGKSYVQRGNPLQIKAFIKFYF